MERKGTKRKAISLETKFEILETVQTGEKKSNIATYYGISPSTLTGILKKDKEIRDAYQCSTVSPSRKRHRSSQHEEIEKSLFEWFKSARAKNLPVSGHVLLAKSDQFAKQLGSSFVPNKSWIDRFKVRHGIVSKAICGESGVVDTDVTENWIRTKLPALTNGFTPDNIFNADETGLFYKLLPNRSLEIKGETCVGGKKAKDRLTFLLACNMTGSEKLPLLVIGKFENPRCFKSVKSLPVIYKSNRRAWMTSVIFKDWLNHLDKQFKRQNRKVLMFVDNCAAHPTVAGLKAITLCFLPPNTTSVLQPCDQGIIYSFNVQYHQRLVNYVIECYDKGINPALNVLVAIRYAYAAWQAVDPTVIQKCFRRSGFIQQEEELMDEDDDVPLAELLERLQDSLPLAMLCKKTQAQLSVYDVVHVDKNLVVTEDKTDEDIIAECQPSDDVPCDDSDDDDDETPHVIVSKETALVSLNRVQYFLESINDIPENVFSALHHVQQTVKSSASKQTKSVTFSNQHRSILNH